MKKAIYDFRGWKLRLDQIQTITPLHTKTSCLDGIYVIFKRDNKVNIRSQYNFSIYFVGENGGYKEFFSKTVDYVGWDNFKGDEKFVDDYNGLVFAWEEYHIQ